MNGPQYEFLLDKLEFCCISGESLLHMIEVMEQIDNRTNLGFHRSNYYTDVALRLGITKEHVELILEILDRKHFSEHGTSVRRSWLTEAGEQLLDGYRDLANAEE